MTDARTPTGELSRMTPSELRIELKRLRAEAAHLRLNLVMQSGKDSAAYKRARKKIARICTVLGGATKKSNSAEKKVKSTSQSPVRSVQRSRSKKVTP